MSRPADGVRETGRRRLLAATAGVGMIAAAVASTVAATRPPPPRGPAHTTVPRPAATQVGAPPVDAAAALPDTTSSGS